MNPAEELAESTTVDMPRLIGALERRAPLDAAELLAKWPESIMLDAIEGLDPSYGLQVVQKLPEELREKLLPKLPEQTVAQWETNLNYPEDTVGRLMEPAIGVFNERTTVAEARESLRELAERSLFTYAYCLDRNDCLSGVVVMRDLLFADDNSLLRDIMVPDPFCFSPDTVVGDAVHDLFTRNYPVYPVCNNEGGLVGLIHGYMLYEEHADQLSATPGRMVGVQNEEHLSTPWTRAFRFRHPWLQANLLTAFLAAAVVGYFEDTISQIVLLAAFLPVLAGQSGNTGCQAMAVTLRALALDELVIGSERRAMIKEAWLGLLNGLLVGITAGIGMFIYAAPDGNGRALMLAGIIVVAMTASCIVSGLTGVLVPLTLRKLGTDPATASSIVLTTATDVISMGLLLALATFLLL